MGHPVVSLVLLVLLVQNLTFFPVGRFRKKHPGGEGEGFGLVILKCLIYHRLIPGVFFQSNFLFFSPNGWNYPNKQLWGGEKCQF